MNLTTPPPDKLSDLIELAVGDARKLDRDIYAPTWSSWHSPHPRDTTCMICLAGTVIAGTLGCARETSIDIAASESSNASVTITDKRWRQALWALDSAREGDWLDALDALHDTMPDDDDLYDKVEALDIPAFPLFNNWKQLNAHLASLAERAEQLRELGL